MRDEKGRYLPGHKQPKKHPWKHAVMMIIFMFMACDNGEPPRPSSSMGNAVWDKHTRHIGVYDSLRIEKVYVTDHKIGITYQGLFSADGDTLYYNNTHLIVLYIGEYDSLREEPHDDVR